MGSLGAQDTAPPAFEVASIRPSRSTEQFSILRQNTGGRFVAENITVHSLIQQAYRLFPFQIVGAPDWTTRERFDVQAIAPGTTLVEGALLQQLLADRFAFRARRETREQDVYALVVARQDGRLGPNMAAFTGDCGPPGAASPCRMRNGPTFTDAVGWPITTIVGPAMGNVQRLVIDKTRLTGRFTFKYEWSNDPTNADGRVAYITALKEQLGLELVSERAPVDMLIIERVERPTPN